MPTKADCRHKHYTIHKHICNKQNITKCACIYEGYTVTQSPEQRQ